MLRKEDMFKYSSGMQSFYLFLGSFYSYPYKLSQSREKTHASVILHCLKHKREYVSSVSLKAITKHLVIILSPSIWSLTNPRNLPNLFMLAALLIQCNKNNQWQETKSKHSRKCGQCKDKTGEKPEDTFTVYRLGSESRVLRARGCWI